MPRGIPASGVRKQRTSRKTSTGGTGGGGQFPTAFWNNFQKLYTQMQQLHQSHGGKQTRGRRGGRTAGTGQKRATGTRQRRAAAA